MRRTTLWLFCLVLLVTGPANAQKPAPPTTTITILQLNDVYEISPVDNLKHGGLARVATRIKEERARSPHTLFMLAGDFISPSLASGEFKGKQMIATLNAAGLDIATLGNHEFDYTLDVLAERMKESRFLYVAANVFDKKTGQPFGGAQPYIIRKFGDVRVAIFGLLTTETASKAKSGGDVRITDPIAAGRLLSRQLRRRGADIVIALTHLSMCEDKRLAREADIDLIVGGHEHELLQALSGRTHISKMGSDGRSLGRIDLHVARSSPRGRFRLKSIDWWALPVDETVASDSDVARVVAEYEDQLKKIYPGLEDKIGTSQVELEARSAVVRRVECNFGNLLADVYRSAVSADIALVNSGGIRSDKTYGPGDITRRDILSILPNKNTLVKVRVTGARIKALLENGVTTAGEEDGRFPQISGMSFEYNPSRPVGSRVSRVDIAGTPLDPAKTYTLAVNAYTFGGGDSYDFSGIADADVLVKPNEGPVDRDGVIDAIQKMGTIAPKVEGRIKSVGAAEQKPALDPCGAISLEYPTRKGGVLSDLTYNATVFLESPTRMGGVLSDPSYNAPAFLESPTRKGGVLSDPSYNAPAFLESPTRKGGVLLDPTYNATRIS
jgi:5'-nucleotidase